MKLTPYEKAERWSQVESLIADAKKYAHKQITLMTSLKLNQAAKLVKTLIEQ